MQSLRYTNLLLTIIAVCLVYQCVKQESIRVQAAPNPVPANKQASGRTAETLKVHTLLIVDESGEPCAVMSASAKQGASIMLQHKDGPLVTISDKDGIGLSNDKTSVTVGFNQLRIDDDANKTSAILTTVLEPTLLLSGGNSSFSAMTNKYGASALSLSGPDSQFFGITLGFKGSMMFLKDSKGTHDLLTK